MSRDPFVNHVLTNQTYYSAMEHYLVVHRLLYDPARGIPIETMRPEKPDWVTLNLLHEPPPGMKAIDAKRQFEREQQARLNAKDEVVKPKAKKPAVKKTPPLPPAQQAKTKVASTAPPKRARSTTPVTSKEGPAKRKPVSPSALSSSSDDDDEVEETLAAIRTPATRSKTVSWLCYCCFSKFYFVRRGLIQLPVSRHNYMLCRLRHVKNVRWRTSVTET